MAHRPPRLADGASPVPEAVVPPALPPVGISTDTAARQWRMRVAFVASVGAIFSLGVLQWLHKSSKTDRPIAAAGATAREQTVTVVPAIVSSHLTLVGTIGPGKTVAALAPFDGVIRERRAQLGALVRVGEVLVVMDTGEVEGRLREAQAAFLKANIALDLLDHWATSPDVIRARRMQEAAEASLSVIERQVGETKKLFDRGIVSRNEYDGLVQQRDNQRNAAAGSRLDLQTTLERGSADNRRLADLEFQNARSRLADLQTQVDGSTVRAPVDGIVARPPINTQSSQVLPAIEAGARVTRGQALFSVADTAFLIVTGRVDEVDVNRLSLGQAVEIGGDAFPSEVIAGRIIGISAEADTATTSGRAPSFEVRAAFPGATGAGRQRIRIGMSARMQIELASNPRAIIIPIDAVYDPLTNPTVRVRDPRNGATVDRSVTLGVTNERGVEILTGLQTGDIIIRAEPYRPDR